MTERDWLHVLTDLRDGGTPAVLVTVAAAKGSTPREAGAKMVVTADAAFGTIGGGNLEHEAMAEARALLASATATPELKSKPLGPALAQCCGGQVSVLLEPFLPVTTRLLLFGAGHVGREVVAVLAGLPLRIDWIDSRQAEFPAAIPPHATRRLTAAPRAEIEAAPPGAYYLVMTHSHDLDQELVEAILRRGDFAYCGLIGSKTKRARFEKRLLAAGIPAQMLTRLSCPIGVPGVTGKRPREIAIAVAAELLALGLSGHG